jgi:hypothetical protein
MFTAVFALAKTAPPLRTVDGNCKTKKRKRLSAARSPTSARHSRDRDRRQIAHSHTIRLRESLPHRFLFRHCFLRHRLPARRRGESQQTKAEEASVNHSRKKRRGDGSDRRGIVIRSQFSLMNLHLSPPHGSEGARR